MNGIYWMATIIVEFKLSLFTSLMHLLRSNNEIEKITRGDSIDIHMKGILINLIDSETIFLN